MEFSTILQVLEFFVKISLNILLIYLIFSIIFNGDIKITITKTTEEEDNDKTNKED